MFFSIIIPAYNYAHFLPRALLSVLSQDENNYEIIVVDDGSTDDTKGVAESFRANASDRIKYIHQANSGPGAARNRGINRSIGEYLIFLDADDRLLPGALKRFRRFIGEKGRYEMVFGGHISTHADSHSKKHPAKPLSRNRRQNFIRYLRREFGISNGATIMARRIFKRIRYPEHLSNSEDVPVFAQVLGLFDCASFPDPVLEVFKHDDSRRNNTDLILQTGMALLDALFDPILLPDHLLAYRDEFFARHKLSLFRSLYVAGRYREARSYYHQAVSKEPRLLSEISYLSKYLRSFLKKQPCAIL
jgi:hypothetical protein